MSEDIVFVGLNTDLFEFLLKYFWEEDLRELSFYLRVEYEDLGGEGRKGKAREIVRLLAREERLEELHRYLRLKKQREYLQSFGQLGLPITPEVIPSSEVAFEYPPSPQVINRILPSTYILVFSYVVLIALGLAMSGDKTRLRQEVLAVTTQPTDMPIPEPTPEAGELRMVILPGGNIQVTQVYVPAGPFLMGSDESDPSAERDEFRKREVTLAQFWIDQTEVTNTQFAVFLNDSGNLIESGAPWLDTRNESSVLIELRSGVFRAKTDWGDYPVIQVSWFGARAYCEWAGGRLPTEAEWEKAARGEDGRLYPWGEEEPMCRLANHFGCVGWLRRVGGSPDGVSPYGALDMAGNVWEWVNDWYDQDYYRNAPTENPQGPPSGTNKVLRGGAWDSAESGMRASDRSINSPNNNSSKVGFRCSNTS